MVFKCCIPCCRGNYDENNKVSVFAFPQDENFRKVWINAIPRKDFTWTKNLRVCEKHFRNDDVERETSAFDENKGIVIKASLKRPRLKPDAVPSIFPGCPSYLTNDSKSRLSPNSKRILSEQQNIIKALEESKKTKQIYDEARTFVNVDELYELEKKKNTSTFWDIIKKKDSVLYLHLNIGEDSLNLSYCIIIESNLNMKLYLNGKAVPRIGEYKFPLFVKDINVIHEVLEYLENMNNSKLENVYITYLNICLHFLTLTGEILEEFNFFGTAYNDDKLATSAFVFMINSFFSSFKEVVHILPAKKMSAEILHNIFKNIILGLESIGFKVIIVVSDNNSINRKCMSYFKNPLANYVYPHPVDPLRPLFYAVDTVHLIKCVRNNWINQKNDEQALYFPDFDLTSNKVCTASFLSVKKLYEIENGNLLKFAYKLTRKALWPNNLERQNVKLALQVFDNNTAKSLLELSNNNIHFNDTAAFIDIFNTWFNIVNVKTPYKGIHSRNIMCEPLTLNEADPKMIFLNKFLDWLKKWFDMTSDTGRMSKETHSALMLTTTTIVELTKYCITELNMSYLLPGKVQTDELEYRFSLYRRLAGANYNISIRQIYEIEKKIKTCSVLKLNLKSHSRGEIPISDLFNNDNSEDLIEIPVNTNFEDIKVTNQDLIDLGDLIVIIAYLAGYCIHSVCNRLKCDGCKMNFVTERELVNIDNVFKLIHESDRGGLKYPVSEIIVIVAYNFIILQKLVSEKYEKLFLNSPNQKSVVSLLTKKSIFEDDILITVCEKHVSENVIKMIISSATNTLLKNYCRNKNDISRKIPLSNVSNKSCKRKLSTLLK